MKNIEDRLDLSKRNPMRGFSLGIVGGLIHILLVIAIIVILVRIIEGRRPL